MIAGGIGGLLAAGLLLTCLTLLGLLTRDLSRAVFRESERGRQRRLAAAARRSATEAAMLAAAAIGDACFASVLYATADEQDGALVWRVASATIDMGVTATVNDASGAVSDIRHWSGWPTR